MRFQQSSTPTIKHGFLVRPRPVRALSPAPSKPLPDLSQALAPLGVVTPSPAADGPAFPVELSARARQQGTYIIGATGTGKSTLMENIIVSDAEQGFGVCLLDPAGDLTASVLARIPDELLGDVVLLNALDVAYPFGDNVYDCRNPSNQLELERTVDEAMHVYRKLWGPGSNDPSWGPRMENILRNASIVLASYPGATMLELPALLTNRALRRELVPFVASDYVRDWWEEEYDHWPERDRRVWIDPVLNKVGAFASRSTLANIIGQSRSTINFRRFMDEGKIVLVPLPAALLGTEVASLLGSLIVGHILTAALSRQNVPRDQRRPFMLFADEYQHFATEDFAQIQAEARKFGLGVTVAHQFLDQLSEKNRAAALTAANLIVFRVSGKDAQVLTLQFDNTPPPGEPDYQMLMRRVGDHYEPVKYAPDVLPLEYPRVSPSIIGSFDVPANIGYQKTQRPPRPYADMHAERGNRLANLHPFTAQARIQEGRTMVEYLLHTLPAGEADPARFRNVSAQVRAQTRAYLELRPRVVVVDEIRKRRAQAQAQATRERESLHPLPQQTRRGALPRKPL